MVDLSLNCMVEGDPTAFPVNIQSTNTVGQLKQAIQAELRLNIPSKDLMLWQVNIPDGASEEEMSNVLSRLNEENKLSPLRRLQPQFPDGAAEGVIHIFVKLLPQPVHSDDNSNMDSPDKSTVTKALKSEEKTEAKRRKRRKGSLTQRLISAISPGPLRHSRRSHAASDEDIVPAFKDMKLIAFGNRPRTFKALWMGDTVFVKKCDMWNERQFIDELQNEIEVYGVLQALQGVWIPRMKLGGIMNGFEVVLATESAGTNISNEHLDPSDCNKIRRALAAVHNCGVLHGDLKPDNIVVRRDGFSSKFMIIDFGLSTFTTDKEKLRCEKEELDSILAVLSRPRSEMNNMAMIHVVSNIPTESQRHEAEVILAASNGSKV
ncbi:hypothetical protein BGZ81_001354 [Podila clonocystis]|nr:hypothetical protein BGZ81_001354 [Podila clonocystis]